MNFILKFCVTLWLLNQVNCWKPLEHSAAYSVQQTFLENDPQSYSVSHTAPNSLQLERSNSFLEPFNKNDFVDDVSTSVHV